MSERRIAASLLSHSLKTPLSSVKVAAQLLRKHVGDQLNEKDIQLLEAIIRNAETLEARINKMIELATPWEDRIFLELEVSQLEEIHSLKSEAHQQRPAAPEIPRHEDEPESRLQTTTAENPIEGKVVIHADPEIADLIPKFLENRQKDIGAIESALERNDFAAIRVLGHSMKGAGGGYGFDGVTEIGKNLEEAAKQEDSAGIREGILSLTEYLRNVEVIYDEQ